MISAERAKEVADLYYDDVYHLCYSRLKNETDASDVTQEVFLFFQESCDELEDNYIKAWLYKVADNKIKEEYVFLETYEGKIEAYTEEYVIDLKNDTFTYGTAFYMLMKNVDGLDYVKF